MAHMGLVTYLGFVGLTLGLGVAVRWFDPTSLDQLARRTGLRAWHGWLLLTVAALWSYLPFLAGATTESGELWLVGPALAAVGFYLGAFAATSVDEYRLLDRADHREPGAVTAGDGDRLVATSGVPTVDSEAEAAARAPVSGRPAVHTDWILQTRERVLGVGRERWQNAATGVRSTPFDLAGVVHVTGGRHRVFSADETFHRFEPDESLPEPAAAFLRERADLPDPDERETPLRAIETVVPADEPVTVVGTPRQGERPGQVTFESAPADPVLGTHADQTTPDDSPEAVLVQGHADAAAALLRKRVYWLGLGGLALIVGGQVLGFALSPASLGALL